MVVGELCRRLLVGGLSVAVALGVAGAVAVGVSGEAVAASSGVSRLAGADRYATAAAVSASAFPAGDWGALRPGVPVAYIASGADFPDALSGAPVAAIQRGPVLLTDPTKLPMVVRTELDRLEPAKIVILGGTGAVSSDVANTLTWYTMGRVSRLAGADRYATAAAVSASAFSPGVPVAYIASGADFPDALSGAPVAGIQRGPVLLTDPTKLPTVVRTELNRLKPAKIVILGGTAAVSSAVATALGSYTSGYVSRLAGPDRYATAAAVSASAFSPGVPVAYVASGADFPDALSGAPVAGIQHGPVLLTDPTRLPTVVRTELSRLKPAKIMILGGTGAVSSAVATALGSYPVNTTSVPPGTGEPTATASSVSAGDYHTCALTTAGGVKCWGGNGGGQLGNGTELNSSIPVDVIGLTSGAQAVSAGDYHTCALTTAGGVKCWGSNVSGQLGNGTTNEFSTSTPVDVAGLATGVQAISAGTSHTCALTTAGGVKCWGDNDNGELGNGTTTRSTTPVDVSGLSAGVQAITAGNHVTCALTTAGGVKCWGDNTAGTLGTGTSTYSVTPADVTGLTTAAQAVSTGSLQTCVVTTVGSVKCWSSSTVFDVTGLATGVQAVSVGRYLYRCALTTVGGVKCWGTNRYGLGDGTTTTTSTTPVDVSGLTSGVQAMSAGYDHACAVTTAGGVKCWGNNILGDLGNGTRTNSTTPVDVQGF